MLANLYIRTGRFDNAIARLAPLLKQNPNLIQARLLSGRAQLSKHDLTGSIAQFEAVTRLNPQLAELTTSLGARCWPAGMFEGQRGNISAPCSSRRPPSRSRSS